MVLNGSRNRNRQRRPRSDSPLLEWVTNGRISINNEGYYGEPGTYANGGYFYDEYTPMDFADDVTSGDIFSPGDAQPELQIGRCQISISIEGRIWIYGFSLGSIEHRFDNEDCRIPVPEPPTRPDYPLPPGGEDDGELKPICIVNQDGHYQVWNTGYQSSTEVETGFSHTHHYPPQSTTVTPYTLQHDHPPGTVFFIKKGGGLYSKTHILGQQSWSHVKGWSETFWLYASAESLYGRAGANVGINGHTVIYEADDVTVRRTVIRGGSVWLKCADPRTGESWDCNPCWSRPPKPDYQPPPPPLPPRPDEDDPMNCCSRLLRELAKMRRDLGLDNLPYEMPRNMVDDRAGMLRVNNIAAMLFYQIEQVDTIAGEFPIKIKVKDINPLEEGDQEIEIETPNLAETLTEIMGFQIKNSVDVNVLLEFCVRIAVELAEIKNGTIINNSIVDSILAWLGLEVDDAEKTVKYSINPRGEGDWGNVLKDEEGKIKIVDLKEKQSLMPILQKLVFAAHVIKAKHFKTNSQISDWIGQIRDAIDDNGEQGSWEEFIDLINTDGAINRTPGAPKPNARNINLDPSSEVGTD